MSTTVVVQDAGLRLPFTAVELTQSINTLPPQFGQMARDGMFPIEPLASAYIEIVSEGGAIYALPGKRARWFTAFIIRDRSRVNCSSR